VCSSKEQRPTALANFIRRNEEALAKSCNQMLDFYSEQLHPRATLSELFNVVCTFPFNFVDKYFGGLLCICIFRAAGRVGFVSDTVEKIAACT